MKTNKVDLEQKDANMYGVVPCPKCKSEFRYPRNDDNMIVCDDCGFKELAEEDEE